MLLLLFSLYLLVGAGKKTPEETMENKKYKRQYRELDDATKKKISAATGGKPKSEIHKQHISQAMKDYWKKVEHRPYPQTTMDDLIGANL